MNTYQKTGYPRGRPRKGELRPVSKNAARCQLWRQEHLDHWREKNREYQANWRAANLERSNEIARNTYHRKKAWDKIPDAKILVEKTKMIMETLQ
jgi:hypothetical protein